LQLAVDLSKSRRLIPTLPNPGRLLPAEGKKTRASG
jgi:hypothetical protein